MEPDELAAWLRLVEAPGVGREGARQLLAAFGSAPAVLAAGVAERRAVVGERTAAALAGPAPEIEDLLVRTLEWLQAGAERRDIIVLGDSRYPRLLLESADPPLLLYAEGHVDLLQADAVAVVGSRNPTPQGLADARAFAAALSRSGLTVVSGLALGIDGAAHDGALDGSGSTVAVVGTGLDRVYPKSHLKLAHRIAAAGLIVSELPIGTPPLPPHFPSRNRIIAGLTRGTLVVEAALESGSLITARLAAEAGRDVFAIPGSIHSPLARGCHALIKQGAKLVDSAADVLDELGVTSAPALPRAVATAAPPAKEDALLAALGFDPISIDSLVERTGLSAGELSVRLLDHELEGRVKRLPGQRFQRVAHG
ncbi:DNA-processing protein DprA [Piscinibacter koreensis]|uniref:DNA-protecting protein DprA n=1 Tax=Piscinibacter koreensis TaxID=2742824 RepID=A0A7Y6NNS3_9BURK|nr:DNA-processing protein DprA [Schlegelella koreensis]NUZ06434.1 DNA-protecting protein DprA [Schlegelella koreensis]